MKFEIPDAEEFFRAIADAIQKDKAAAWERGRDAGYMENDDNYARNPFE